MTYQAQQLPADHRPLPSEGIGVLLVNLGTPDAPTPAAVKRYLAEFLSDPRVVEIPPLVWQPILRGIILNTRPKKSAHAYRQVWTEQGSPLAAITAAQAEACRSGWGRWMTARSGPLGDALRQSGDRERADCADGCRVQAHPRCAALSAIFRGDQRQRGRCCG